MIYRYFILALNFTGQRIITSYISLAANREFVSHMLYNTTQLHRKNRRCWISIDCGLSWRRLRTYSHTQVYVRNKASLYLIYRSHNISASNLKKKGFWLKLTVDCVVSMFALPTSYSCSRSFSWPTLKREKNVSLRHGYSTHLPTS